MFFLILSIGLIAITTLLILTIKINIYPEVFFLSWLINKGLLPYRDFFDDHGFLLQLLLSPFTINKTLLYLHFLYLMIHIVNLLLIIIILKKSGSKIALVISGIIQVLLMFFLSENNLWFELLITTFYIFSLFLLQSKLKLKNLIAGFMLGLATLVKPTAAIAIFPLLFIYPPIQIVIGFSAPIVTTLIFFLINRGLPGLIDNVGGYNLFLLKFYRPSYLSDQKFLLSAIALIILSISIIWYQKQLHKIKLPLVFLLLSIIFLASGYTRVRLVPMGTFFAVLIGQTIGLIKGRWRRYYLMIIGIFIVIMGVKVIQHYKYLQNRITYIEDPHIQTITDYLRKNKIKNFFIIGNYVQPYYFLNQLPPTYFPLRYPLVEQYYPNFEKKIATDLIKKNIKIIIVPKTEIKNWQRLIQFLTSKYRFKTSEKTFSVFIQKN